MAQAQDRNYFSDLWDGEQWYEEHWAPNYRFRHGDSCMCGCTNDYQVWAQYWYLVASPSGRDPEASGTLDWPSASRHEQQVGDGRKENGIPVFAPGQQAQQRDAEHQRTKTRIGRDLKRLSYVADYNKHWDSMSPEERVSQVKSNKTFIHAPIEEWCPCVGCRAMQEAGQPCGLGWGRMLRLYKNVFSREQMLDAREETITLYWWSCWNEGLSRLPED